MVLFSPGHVAATEAVNLAAAGAAARHVPATILGFPYWSLSAYVKGKVKRAVDFVVDFEHAVVREAPRRGMDGVVCGHIHRAAMREVQGVLYCNTGDWVESCTALVERADGALELLAIGSDAQPAGIVVLEPAGAAVVSAPAARP